MLLVGLVGRRALVRVGISLSVVQMRWLRHMLVLLLIGGSPSFLCCSSLLY